MSAAVFDTSALVKLLVDEDGSPAVEELWRASEPRVCSRIAYVEARAAMARARIARRLDTRQAETAKRVFERLWLEAVIVELTDPLARRAANLTERHGLRAYDAIHVATALASGAIAIVTADAQQLRAAEAEGLRGIDPTEWGTR